MDYVYELKAAVGRLGNRVRDVHDACHKEGETKPPPRDHPLWDAGTTISHHRYP